MFTLSFLIVFVFIIGGKVKPLAAQLLEVILKVFYKFFLSVDNYLPNKGIFLLFINKYLFIFAFQF